jgi:hypothetical protein
MLEHYDGDIWNPKRSPCHITPLQFYRNNPLACLLFSYYADNLPELYDKILIGMTNRVSVDDGVSLVLMLWVRIRVAGFRDPPTAAG